MTSLSHNLENLLAHPDVEIQVWNDVIPVRARTATAEEKKRVWPIMTAQWPDYDNYQARYDELWSQGWRIHLLNNYLVGANVYYNAVWRRGTEAETQFYGLSYKEYQAKDDELAPKHVLLNVPEAKAKELGDKGDSNPHKPGPSSNGISFAIRST